MSGRGAVMHRRPEAPEYELDTGKNYQLVFVKNNEGEEEFERLELFEERILEAVGAGYMPVGSPVKMNDKYSDYYLIQGILKRGGANNNAASDPGNNANEGGARRRRGHGRKRSTRKKQH